MSRRTHWSRLFIVFVVLGSLVMTALPVAAQDSGSSKGFSKRERERLAEARHVRGDRRRMVDRLQVRCQRHGRRWRRSLGGTVEKNDTEVSMPGDRANGQAEAVAKLNQMRESNSTTWPIPLEDPRPAGADTPTRRPRRDRPPRAATRTCQSSIPGRPSSSPPTPSGTVGVTVGVVDSGIDLDHPSLKTTSTGERNTVELGDLHRLDVHQRREQ